jgi:hypothetical protein
MLSEAVGHFFKPRRETPEVREGAIYRHNGSGNIVETAQVLHVGPDPMGITHVRYKVMVEQLRERRTNFQEWRTLNLESFTTYFSETVDA